MTTIADKGINAAFGENLRNLPTVTIDNGLVELQDILIAEPKEAESLVDIAANDKWTLLAGGEKVQERKQIAWSVVERRSREQTVGCFLQRTLDSL